MVRVTYTDSDDKLITSHSFGKEQQRHPEFSHLIHCKRICNWGTKDGACQQVLRMELCPNRWARAPKRNGPPNSITSSMRKYQNSILYTIFFSLV
jgi:hypothetical protein